MPDRITNLVTKLMKLMTVASVLAVVVVAASALLLFGDGEPGRNGGGAQVASAAEVSGSSGPYRSRPGLNPPKMIVNKNTSGSAGGKILIGSKEAGAGIYTKGGELIWFLPGVTMDFRVQRYRGKPVLTWYQAATKGSGLKRSTYIIANRNYKTIKKVRPGGGLDPDSHEFRLTKRGTALVTTYRTRGGFNLSEYGLGTNALVLESVAQEVDIRTGRVLWQWNSLDHVPVRDTYAEKARRPGAAFDYFHINTVSEARDGNILISGRSTNAMYKISRETGRVIWTLGGRSSDFKMKNGAFFSSQHDTEQISKNRFSLFDNGASPVATPVRDQSRGLILQLNFKKMSASVHREFFNPAKPLSTQQANNEQLPNGNFLLGWGGTPLISEHKPNGALLYDAEFKGIRSFYRAYLQNWSGQPKSGVAMVSERAGPKTTRVWISWNGDSRVRKWRIAAGNSKRTLGNVAVRKRDGFETAVNVPSGATYFKVAGLDSKGRKISASAVKKAGAGN
jgi:hypothetical protein